MEYKYCYVLDFTAEMICRLELQAAEKKPEDFEDLLDFFRSDGDDVIGYIDNPNSHKCFVEEDMEEVPFDFSLLEKAVPVVDLLL